MAVRATTSLSERPQDNLCLFNVEGGREEAVMEMRPQESKRGPRWWSALGHLISDFFSSFKIENKTWMMLDCFRAS